MLEPIVKTIEVPCSQQNAFDIFVNSFHSWWPVERFSCSAYEEKLPKGLKVDAQAGGKIIEIGHDDTEHHWGTFKDYDPYGYFSMYFHMMMSHCESLVEVTFTELESLKTRVELKHSNFEAYGDMAEMNHSGYGTAWDVIFGEVYKAACSK